MTSSPFSVSRSNTVIDESRFAPQIVLQFVERGLARLIKRNDFAIDNGLIGEIGPTQSKETGERSLSHCEKEEELSHRF